MIGSIIGDIVGSVYEFANIKTKDFPLFGGHQGVSNEYTDDSILSFATADWLLHGGDVAHYYFTYAKAYPYPMGSYGGMFVQWLHRVNRGLPAVPYNSCGNGSAMRVGPVGWAYSSRSEVLAAAKVSAECTHNHPEGIKGAQAVALCIWMARGGAAKEDIRREVEARFAYDLSFSCDSIRLDYGWGGTCQDSVPQAIRAFLDGKDFEDSIRNAISLGGDSDTLACITGSIAEAYFGVPRWMRDKAITYLPQEFISLLESFEHRFGNKIV